MIGLFLALAAAPRAQAQGGVSGSNAFRTLTDQVAMGPRVPGTEAHRRAIAYLSAELRRDTPLVSVEPFTVMDGTQRLALTNLVAVFGRGRGDPAMLAAHWDSRPRSERDPHPEHRALPTPGANDGASGVAVALEVARELKGRDLPREVRIALFDGEDWGVTIGTMFYGSRAYVAHHRSDLPAWGILVDMVGSRGLTVPREGFSSARAPDLLDAIYQAADEQGLSAQFPHREGPQIYDDHLPFLEAGVPFVDLIDFDSPHWHTVHDLPSDCAPRSLEAVATVTLKVLTASR